MKKAFISILLLFAIGTPTPVYACTCFCKTRGLEDPIEMKREANLIFVGEVLEVRQATDEERRHHADFNLMRVRVERYWKGVKTKEVTISGMGVTAMCCNTRFEPNKKYLIYTVGKNYSTACTRTSLVEKAGEDLKALGPGKTFSK